MDALGTSKKQNLKNKGEIQIPFAELSAKAVRDQIFNNACSLLSSQAKSLVLQTARAIRKVLPITADYPSNPIAFSRSDPPSSTTPAYGEKPAPPSVCRAALGPPLPQKQAGFISPNTPRSRFYSKRDAFLSQPLFILSASCISAPPAISPAKPRGFTDRRSRLQSSPATIDCAKAKLFWDFNFHL